MKSVIKTSFATILIAVFFTVSFDVSFAAADKPGKSISKIEQGVCWAAKQPSWLVTFDNGFVGCVARTTGTKNDDPTKGKITNLVDYRANWVSEWGWAFDQGKNHMIIYKK